MLSSHSAADPCKKNRRKILGLDVQIQRAWKRNTGHTWRAGRCKVHHSNFPSLEVVALFYSFALKKYRIEH